jgi:hypothetical protein
MSIFVGNEIRDWLVTKGVAYPIAASIQSEVLSLETAGAFTAKDQQMIFAIERTVRSTMDYYNRTYPTLTPAQQASIYNAYYSIAAYMRHFVMEQGMREYVSGQLSPAEVIIEHAGV